MRPCASDARAQQNTCEVVHWGSHDPTCIQHPADAPALGTSIALSAAVIIGAVVFGLACGTGLGLLLIKCYGCHRYRSFGPRPHVFHFQAMQLFSLSGAWPAKHLPVLLRRMQHRCTIIHMHHSLHCITAGLCLLSSLNCACPLQAAPGSFMLTSIGGRPGGRLISLPEFALLRWALDRGDALVARGARARGSAWTQQDSLDPAEAAPAAGWPWQWHVRPPPWPVPPAAGELMLLTARGPPNTPTSPHTPNTPITASAAAGAERLDGAGGSWPLQPAAPATYGTGEVRALRGLRRPSRAAPPTSGVLALLAASVASGGGDLSREGSGEALAGNQAGDSAYEGDFTIPAFRSLLLAPSAGAGEPESRSADPPRWLSP